MSKTVPGSQTRHAWRQFCRQTPPARSAKERLGDFREVHGIFDETTAREQASRCIQCPNPSCVSGCPLCNHIPEWMQLTAEGRFLEAAELLGRNGSLAEICARLCPAEKHCEHNCILDGVSEAVSISGLERFLTDYAARHQVENGTSAPPNGRRVAVIGSGPCGLACADELASRGCAVTVYDDAPEPGGLLTELIPPFRVDDAIIKRRLNLMKKRGVKFQTNAERLAVGRLERLQKEYDAVFLGAESREARKLDVPGAMPPAVMQAKDFISISRNRSAKSRSQVDLTEKRVVVIGGGDTAMDCARVALRMGAAEALCIYRRGEDDLPCTCMAYREARDEGVRFAFQAAPVQVLLLATGGARGIRLIKTQAGSLQFDGRHEFSILPGTEHDLEADLVVMAIGFTPRELPREGELAQLSRNDWGGLVVNESLMTSLQGVFAGGDLVRGPVKVIAAIRDGKTAAGGIMTYLNSL